MKVYVSVSDFTKGDRVKITIPLWNKIRYALVTGDWLPKYGTYMYDREDYAAYVIVDDNGKPWYIAWGYLELSS